MTAWDPRFFERSALFAPIAEAAGRLASFASFPTPEAIDAALSDLAGIRFVRQVPRPRRARAHRDPSSMYDAQILAGRVPTRAGSWHDLLNALVWASFPKAKRALHERQHALVLANGIGAPTRTPELDALAMIDEGGIVVGAAGAATVFGHAIYEGLVRRWPSPIAKAIRVEGSDHDRGLAAVIEAGGYLEHVRLPLAAVSGRALTP